MTRGCAPVGNEHGVEKEAEIKTFEKQVERPGSLAQERPVMVGRGLACAGGWMTETLVCPNDDYEAIIHPNTCGRVGCPSCWTTWAHRASRRIGERVVGYHDLMPTKHAPRHMTFDLVDLDPKKAKAQAKKLGLEDFVLVIHAWRIVGDSKTAVKAARKKNDVSRYDVVRDSADFDKLTYYSPHAHVIAFGKAFGVEKGSDDYQYRNISTLKSIDDVQACAYYLLSHTHIPMTRNGASYWYGGRLSPQRLKPAWTNKKMEVLRCPKCRAALVYPGSNICKEMLIVTHGGWKLIAKSRRKSKKKLPSVSLTVSPPAAAVVPCFYAEPLQIVQASPAR